MIHRVTTSGSTNDNEWQRVVQGMKTAHENFKEWMIAILTMTKAYTTASYGWLQVEWLNKETSFKVFQESSWYYQSSYCQKLSVPYNH